MSRKAPRRHGLRPLLTIGAAAVLGLSPGAGAAGPEARHRLPGSDLAVEHLRLDAATGSPELVRFAAPRALPPGADPVARAVNFLARHGTGLGLVEPSRQLRPVEVREDLLGRSHAVFEQVVAGVPVFGVRMTVHFDLDGAVAAVSGAVVPDLDLDPVPSLPATDAEAIAVRIVAKGNGRFHESLEVAPAELVIYREGLVRGVPGANHLAWQVEVTSGPNLHEVLYVDAHDGRLVDRRSEVHHLDRVVHLQTMPNPVWSEGDPLPYSGSSGAANAEITELARATGDAHALFANISNGHYLSFDGHDATMNAIYDAADIDCPNAVETGGVTAYCTGMVSDDVVAHEWTHAYTGWTHGLVYQWQPGALNEATSDIFGELADQLNGRGDDLPGDPRPAGSCSTAGGRPSPSLELTSPASAAGSYPVGGAVFNPEAPWSVTGPVELADDGVGVPSDACELLAPMAAGTIALVDRGTCLFRDKVARAQAAGAAGVIVVNNQGDDILEMGGDTAPLGIPAVFVGRTDGDLIRAALGQGVTATLSLAGDFADSVRWLIGEDTAALGAIRDMWSPTCFGDPDRVSSAHYHCNGTDNGGVHSNSGIPNLAFALLVDGGRANGRTVEEIGATKAARIYWRAMSVYQTPVTDFRHHADILETSCLDLVGATLFDPRTGQVSPESVTPHDCLQVAAAMDAVEMRRAPDQCLFSSLLEPDAPALDGNLLLFEETFDADPGAWQRSNRGVFPEYSPRDWVWTEALPVGGDGGALFAVDSVLIGDCQPGSDDQSGVMEVTSPEITIPLGVLDPILAFDHWLATEPEWDGGNLKISVNGGPFVLVPGSAFRFNPYNGRITASGNANPLAGEPAFTGTDEGSMGGSWGQSQVELSRVATAGDRVRLRFDLGVDGCNGAEGWYLDRVVVTATGAEARRGGSRVRP
jgi:Zn-dependent metalloprotease